MTKFEGLSPRQNKRAIELHRDYVRTAEEYEPHQVAGTRKAAQHFKDNETAYKQQAVLEANADGVEINYPPYTERRLPESNQVDVTTYEPNRELGRQAFAAHRPPGTVAASRHPSPELGSRTAK